MSRGCWAVFKAELLVRLGSFGFSSSDANGWAEFGGGPFSQSQMTPRGAEPVSEQAILRRKAGHQQHGVPGCKRTASICSVGYALLVDEHALYP